MAVQKFFLGEMTWMEAREVVREGRLAVLPAGIIEQHGPHLPLDTDIFLAEELTARAAALHPEKVVVVPPIVHGHSPHHMDFPGTLTVDPRHMLDYVLDVCLSLSHHGFRKILIVNGHGSNAPVLDLAARQTIIRTGGKTSCASILYTDSVEFGRASAEVFPEMAGRSGHADDVETSMYMALRPDLVQMEKAEDDPITDVMMVGSARLPLRLIWSSFSKQGIYGIVHNASYENGVRLVSAAVEGLAKLFVQFHEKQIPEPRDHHTD
jgi:creatinine amidohydrolase